ncbi:MULTISPECIES: phasin family protein [Paracoccus]|uniref:Phasin family protein n=1 Tax=Paracoccus fontiphilus TaxID=1815556 RepID=A0ABV7ID31_9RHOB
MAKTTTETPNADRVLERMGEAELSFIRPLGAFNTAMADAYMDLVEEWTNFVMRRTRQDIRMLHQILHCRDATQIQQIQGAFVQKAITEYQEEAGRVSAILQHANRTITEKNAQEPAQT